MTLFYAVLLFIVPPICIWAWIDFLKAIQHRWLSLFSIVLFLLWNGITLAIWSNQSETLVQTIASVYRVAFLDVRFWTLLTLLLMGNRIVLKRFDIPQRHLALANAVVLSSLFALSVSRILDHTYIMLQQADFHTIATWMLLVTTSVHIAGVLVVCLVFFPLIEDEKLRYGEELFDPTAKLLIFAIASALFMSLIMVLSPNFMSFLISY